MIRDLTEGIVTLLRANLVDPLGRSGKWIYPGAVRLDATMPRISIIHSGAAVVKTSLNATKVWAVYFDIFIYVRQGEKYHICIPEGSDNCDDYAGGKLLDFYSDQIKILMDNLPANISGVVDYPELVNSYIDYSLVEEKILMKKMRYKILYMDNVSG